MRKLILLLAVMVVMMFSSSLRAQFTGDGFKQTIKNTDHDLSGNNVDAVAVCEFCHAPHKIAGMGNGAGPATAVPLLWNIQVKAGPFAVYGGSSTFNSTTVRDPSTASPANLAAYMSLLCLSCHDGQVTASNFYYTEVLGTVAAFTPPNVGEDAGLGLSNDHPVDFTYSVALATSDGGLKSPTEGAGVRIPYVGNTVSLPLFKDATGDTSGRLECATCHNPHNHANNYFLRKTNTGSAICLECHGS